jgi:hypothetical protein
MYAKNYPKGAFHETAGDAIRISQPKPGTQELLCRRDASPIYPNHLAGYAGDKTGRAERMFEKSSDQDSRRGPGFAPAVWKLELGKIVGEI